MIRVVIDFVESVATTTKIMEPIIDFGGLLVVEQQEEFGNAVRNIFAGKEYKTFDERAGADIVGNVCSILLPDESVGTALLLETLEHLAYPQRAVNELYKVLKPDGLLILTTLMCWEEHRCPKDYWRFLPDGVELLLTEACFSNINIILNGVASEPSSIFAIARKVINGVQSLPKNSKRWDSYTAWRDGHTD